MRWAHAGAAGVGGAAARVLALAGVLLVSGCANPPPAPESAAAPYGTARAPGRLALLPPVQGPDVPEDAPQSRVVPVEIGPSLPPEGAPEAFEHGGASWYGTRFQNRRTASGERFDMNTFTAAHRTLPFGTLVCVHSQATGRTVLVRVNDRGPHARQRVIDISLAAAESLGTAGLGVTQVGLFLPPAGSTDCE